MYWIYDNLVQLLKNISIEAIQIIMDILKIRALSEISVDGNVLEASLDSTASHTSTLFSEHF